MITNKIIKDTSKIATADLELFNIGIDIILGVYKEREQLHAIFQRECQKKGLIYGGRSWFTKFDEETGKPISSHSINQPYGLEAQEMGVNRKYKKLDKEVTDVIQRTLIEYHRNILENIDKKARYEFGKISIGKDGIESVIGIGADLIHDIEHTREWIKQSRKILINAKKDLERQRKEELKALKKENKERYLLTMDQLEEIGKMILGRSTELCPIETGFLRSSGIIVSYNNYIRIIYVCPYASYVHENLTNNHPFGQAKFLETAAQEILGNRSVWVEIGENVVDGEYYTFEWLKTSKTHAYLVKKDSYGTVYMDIDRNLNVNYHHYMG